MNSDRVRETFEGREGGAQLIPIFNDPNRFLLTVNTSENFNSVEISQRARTGAARSIDIYAMCIAPPAEAEAR
ncbi:MAG: hypothetical protein NVV73_04495 [Cellvibrionaceae bacterium]|nr:hypothetical protein [Cellvibrionaceae bacterium]